MLGEDEARTFSRSWYAAWNRHDLDGIMAHYADGIAHSSPFIARYNHDPECKPLRGKAAVRDYFGRALQRNPTLRFDPMHLGVGVDTVALVYRRMTGEVAVETFRFRAGLVEESVSHYGA
jgi:ketosteroid isomerase-like protein